MQVESIHHLIACAFVLMWVLIGHLTMRRRPTSENHDTAHRRVDHANPVQRPASSQKRHANFTANRY